MQNQVINLNLIPGGTPPVVNASQYDEGRTFRFYLWDGQLEYTIPNNANVKINGIKPDMHGFSYLPSDGVIEIDAGRHSVTVTTSQQMTCVYGSVTCEIVIVENDHDIGSANFVMEVELAPINDDTIVSDTELPAIITEAEEQAERAEAAADSIADVAEFIRLHQQDIENAGTYAANAHQSEINAGNSATSAAGSATSASASATNAATSATSAGNSASAAATSETNAANSATTASNAASTATQKASDAATSASGAADSATAAGNSATAAASSATDAATSATSAGTSATNAANSATSAGNSATSAAGSATTAGNHAEDSEAWAVGERSGVPVSSGDETWHNNAKYWAEAAAGAAGGGVSSFNGRSGIVTPQTGDYGIAQISATGTQGQLIGFTANNTLGAVDAPNTGHQILDSTGTAVADKSKLQFNNCNVANSGDKTVVTPTVGGVSAEDVIPVQTTPEIPIVNSFNGRNGAVSPQSGDYTAAMVGALPTQTGTAGQLLGFTADNVVGAVNAPATGVTTFNGRTGAVSPQNGDYNAAMVGALPTQTGTAGQVLGFTANNTVGAKDPTSLYTGAQGKVLGFTSANTVGAMDAPAPTYTGSQGQVLGFTANNTVGAMDVPAQYIEPFTSNDTTLPSPPSSSTDPYGTIVSQCQVIIPSATPYSAGGDGLYAINIMGQAITRTSSSYEYIEVKLVGSDGTTEQTIYQTSSAYPAMSALTVSSVETRMRASLLLYLKEGTKLKIYHTASPATSGGISMGSPYLGYSCCKLEF